MKRIYIILTLSLLTLRGVCQPVIISPSFPGSVDLFDLFEVSFTLGDSYVNPYDPDTIDIYALFIAPDNTTFKVNAFYYEDYSFQKVIVGNDYYEKVADSLNDVGWRIRFTPNQVGNWRFKIFATDANGTTNYPNYLYCFFSCNSVNNAKGFIIKANARYLKREIVKNGQKQFHSFFPVGPNIAWYGCLDYCYFQRPTGIYFYEDHIDSLYNKANYMRIWINRYQYLSLYGLEYTQPENGVPKVYFDSIVNQKDSAELDAIIDYAAQHDIAIMLSIFNQNDFKIQKKPCSPSDWVNNPFHTILQLENPCDFFTDPEAIRITKNLIRYIISRWGYATNIMCWELWNEVANMFNMCEGDKHIEQDVQEWHDEMATYLALNDPFHHCITSSTGNPTNHPYLFDIMFSSLDISQHHNYQNIQKAKSNEQLSYVLYVKANESHNIYPTHPFFMGEFGFGQNSSSPSYVDKDPFGIDLHNSLWSSLFSGSIGPASFWWWDYLGDQGLFHRFTPLLNFCESLPLLSETFTSYQTGQEDGHKLVFPNNIETYYMINATEDTIYGWSQDTAFAYQSLRWLTDYVIPYGMPHPYHFMDNGVFDPIGYVYTLNLSKRPQPSSNSNTIEIPITNQPVGSKYLVIWYNSETGYAYNKIPFATVIINAEGDKVVSFNFPSFIRDLQHQTITNTFGDVVFSLFLSNLPNPPVN